MAEADLERIYNSITTSQEREAVKPIKDILDDINWCILHNAFGILVRLERGDWPRSHITSYDFKIKIVDRLRYHNEGKPLILGVWCRWLLRFFHDEIMNHCTDIEQTFVGMDGWTQVPNKDSDTQDSSLMPDDVDNATAFYQGYESGDGDDVRRRFGIFYATLEAMVRMHMSVPLIQGVIETLQGELKPVLRLSVSRELCRLLDTRAWRRRWVLLLVGAMCLQNPAPRWAEGNPLRPHQQQPAYMFHMPPLQLNLHMFQSVLAAILSPKKVCELEDLTALVVMNEQMKHVFVPMAERALDQRATTPSSPSTIMDVAALSLQFLMSLDAYLLVKMQSRVAFFTRASQSSAELLEHHLRSVIMVHLAVDPADAVAVPSPSIADENSTIGTVASIEESSLSSDAASQDSVDGSGATHTVHSLLHHLLHEASHDRLRRFLCGGAAHPDLVDQITTQPPSEMNSIIAARVNDEGNDTNRSELVELLRIACGLCVSHTTTFEYWHLLSIGEQPQNLGSVGIRCICDIFCATTESLLMNAYSSAVREASTQQQHQHQHQSTDTQQDTSLPQHNRLPSNVQHEAVIALIETAIHCTWRMEELGDLDELNTMMTTTMRKLLAQIPPEATREYHCVILEAIHNYLLTAQSNIHNTPVTQTGVVDATRSIITLVNHVELRAALKLTLFINEEHPFFRHMDAALRVRLLSRPPPSSHFDDNVFEKQRHQLETDVLNYLSSHHGCKEQVQRMLSVCDTFHSAHFISHTSPATPIANVTDTRPASQPSHVPLPPTSLVVHVLDMCHWGYHPSTYLVIQQTFNTITETATRSSAIFATTTSTTTTIVSITTTTRTNTSSTVPKNSSSDAEELPFPADLAAALVDYTHEYQQQQHHEKRQLHWCRDYAYTTFVMYYPQDGGLPTTIHGTLLLQRLFVALVEYKRVGVTWSRLAARAHMSVEELKEQLHKCVELSLLVCVGKDDEGEEGHDVEYVAMNYDYVRPVESTDGVIVLWPEPPRHVRDIVIHIKAFTDAQRVEQLAPVVMSIMKERKSIRYSELFDLVCAAMQTFFVPTQTMLKASVEVLADRHYLSRTVEEGAFPVTASSIVLEYVP